jgi:hypothetical protein
VARRFQRVPETLEPASEEVQTDGGGAARSLPVFPTAQRPVSGRDVAKRFARCGVWFSTFDKPQSGSQVLKAEDWYGPKTSLASRGEARQWNSLFKTATGAAQHMFRIDIK